MTDKQKEKLIEVNSYIESMDILFLELYDYFLSQPLLGRSELPSFAGIYVFYDNKKPIYVGRTNNIKKRISGHSLPSSNHNSANFAFNLAKLEFEEKLEESVAGRDALMKDENFIEKFSTFKKQLFASKVRCIEIQNDKVQTLFEPYLALKLGTYPCNNNFDNH